jgi:hypothetical protein
MLIVRLPIQSKNLRTTDRTDLEPQMGHNGNIRASSGVLFEVIDHTSTL